MSKSKAQWYIVLYRIESIMGPLDDPFGFRCFADDKEHAEEQCINAYPDCDVVWVSLKENYRETVKEFWNQEESHEQD